ncbi:sigma-70 family RNA polymerase sigma factor [uncultured Paludibaculum sp.]|uniref:RNA polymerase sigma factor n=1 Tax=uncultured Paludibaculum sp. TaxID=1765020 RepID=UPI002AABC27C|nr:sigma-70 family RNA polymerase sigma factor [uncultured Paludibaculum sp.]
MPPLCDAPCLRLTHASECSGGRCLIDSARKGDEDAREAVFARLHARVYRQARMLCRHHCDAEDLTQTALLRVFEKLAQLRDAPRLLSWTWRIVLNAHRMSARHGKFAPSLTLEFDEATESSHTARRPGPFEQLTARELQRAVRDGIRTLPPSLRVVFEQRVSAGRTTRETAADLRISTEAVRTRLVRARRALRVALDGEGQDTRQPLIHEETNPEVLR